MKLSRIAPTISLLALTVAACTSDGEPVATATPQVDVVHISETVTATAAPSTPEPVATTWVPLIAARAGHPSVAPEPNALGIGLDRAGLPKERSGGLVVYAKEFPSSYDSLEIVVFDLGSQTRLSSFPVEANSSIHVGLGGTRVIVNFGHELWSYALDGSDGIQLFSDESQRIEYFRPSPDGGLLAFACGYGCDAPTVWILDPGDGRPAREFDLLKAVPGWAGSPSFTGWANNEAVFVSGLCNCDVELEEPLPTALLGIEGTATIVAHDAPRIPSSALDDPEIIFVCDTEERSATDTSDWLQPVPRMDPAGFGAPFDFTSERCDGRSPTIEMRIGGVVVDTDAKGYRVLGFLQTSSNSEAARICSKLIPSTVVGIATAHNLGDLEALPTELDALLDARGFRASDFEQRAKTETALLLTSDDPTQGKTILGAQGQHALGAMVEVGSLHETTEPPPGG